MAWHVPPSGAGAGARFGAGISGAGAGAGARSGAGAGAAAGAGAGAAAGVGDHHSHSVLGTSYHLRQGRALAALETVLLARAEDHNLLRTTTRQAMGPVTAEEETAAEAEVVSIDGRTIDVDVEDDEEGGAAAATGARTTDLTAAAAAARASGGLHQQLQQHLSRKSQPRSRLTLTFEEWSAALRAPLSAREAAGLLAVAAPVAVVGLHTFIQKCPIA